MILDHLLKKEGLLPSIKQLIAQINDNKELIKKEIMQSKTTNLEIIMNSLLKEAVA